MRRTSTRRHHPALNTVFLGTLLLLMAGCEMFEWAHPRQLWKLNRQPALGRDDSYFSIPAEAPADRTEKRHDPTGGQDDSPEPTSTQTPN